MVLFDYKDGFGPSPDSLESQRVRLPNNIALDISYVDDGDYFVTPDCYANLVEFAKEYQAAQKGMGNKQPNKFWTIRAIYPNLDEIFEGYFYAPDFASAKKRPCKSWRKGGKSIARKSIS